MNSNKLYKQDYHSSLITFLFKHSSCFKSQHNQVSLLGLKLIGLIFSKKTLLKVYSKRVIKKCF